MPDTTTVTYQQTDVTKVTYVDDDTVIIRTGTAGPPGRGVPTGGTTGQVLAKASNTNYDDEWVDAASGGGAVDSVTAGDGTVTIGGTATDPTVKVTAATFQPLDSDLTAIAALTTTSYGRGLLELANAAALRTAAALVIGTDVQAHDADLDALAGLVSAANKLPYFTGSGTAALTDLSVFIRSLLDDTDAATARTTLGLGTAATSATGDFDASGAAAAAQAASQPLDSDLTAIAALTTTSFGRAFLALADAAAGRTALALGTAAQADTGTGAANVPTITQADARYDATGAAAAAQAASQPLDSDLTAIAALTTTSYGRAFLALADAAAGRTALGLGTAATSASTDFQPIDSDLTAIAALSTTSFGRSVLALADAAALRTLAALGGAAVLNVGTTAGTVAAGDDSRLSDTRTPTDNTVTSAKIVDGAIVNADINSSAAIVLSKLAVDPLARANHTGTQTAATVSDFDTQVRTSTLNQMTAPSADLSVNTHKLTGVTDPTAAQDAATKNYVDALSFVILYAAPPLSQTNYATYTLINTNFAYFGTVDNGGTQNAVIVWSVPPLSAGTWTFVFLLRTAADGGILTVETSTDNSSWTSQTTVDAYTAGAATSRTAVTGLSVATNTRYLRVRMATKNASSSNYYGRISGIHGVRTA